MSIIPSLNYQLASWMNIISKVQRCGKVPMSFWIWKCFDDHKSLLFSEWRYNCTLTLYFWYEVISNGLKNELYSFYSSWFNNQDTIQWIKTTSCFLICQATTDWLLIEARNQPLMIYFEHCWLLQDLCNRIVV